MCGSKKFYQCVTIFFVVDEGREHQSTTKMRAIIGLPAKRHLMVCLWRADDGPTLNADLVFRSPPLLLRYPIFFVIFLREGGGAIRTSYPNLCIRTCSIMRSSE